jgi:hypothetical protein
VKFPGRSQPLVHFFSFPNLSSDLPPSYERRHTHSSLSISQRAQQQRRRALTNSVIIDVAVSISTLAFSHMRQHKQQKHNQQQRHRTQQRRSHRYLTQQPSNSAVKNSALTHQPCTQGAQQQLSVITTALSNSEINYQLVLADKSTEGLK